MTLVELFSQKGTWTQGAEARNINGERVSSNSTTAVCFCLLGAVNRCYQNKEDYHRVNARLRTKLRTIIGWNDHPGRTQHDVYLLCRELKI